MKYFRIFLIIIIFCGFVLASTLSVMSEENPENNPFSRHEKLFKEDITQILKEFRAKETNTDVYVLLYGGGWSEKGYIVLTLDNTKATINQSQLNGRFITREIERSELEEFLNFIKNENIDSLGSISNGVLDATNY